MTGVQRQATIGVVENANAVVLVTVGPDRTFLDRRTLVLTPPGLSTHPHHHEGSWAVGRYRQTPGARTVSLGDAIGLVQRVQAAAEDGARDGLGALAGDLTIGVAALAIRQCPSLPATIEARIRDNRAQTCADSVMYRQALAAAARARGWSVLWYDRDVVASEAAARLGDEDLDAVLRAMGRSAGPPWRATHRLAAIAALWAGRPAHL